MVVGGRFTTTQRQSFEKLVQQLRPYWRTEQGLPARIQSLLTSNKSFGSRDRRLYRELIYTTLRYLPWIEPYFDEHPDEAIRRIACMAADLPATRPFRDAYGLGDSPTGHANELLPAWFQAHCPEAFLKDQAATILSRAPLWIRLQTDDVEKVKSMLAADGFAGEESRVLESALRLPDGSNISNNKAYKEVGPCLSVKAMHSFRFLIFVVVCDSVLSFSSKSSSNFQHVASPSDRRELRAACLSPHTRSVVDSLSPSHGPPRQGLLEVQDLGSQLLLSSLPVASGSRWLDACAGAGGKTLQLARLVGPRGTVTAHDIRPTALAELAVRAARAKLKNVRIADRLPTDTFDGVLVDAPCSGCVLRSPPSSYPTPQRREAPLFIAEHVHLRACLTRHFGR
jgi:16S rRNA (cytosine967-C5)-methyltransferase